MTLNQKINQLIVLHDAAYDSRQQAALKDAIILMKNKVDLYELAYMRGYRDAKRKGDEA